MAYNPISKPHSINDFSGFKKVEVFSQSPKYVFSKSDIDKAAQSFTEDFLKGDKYSTLTSKLCTLEQKSKVDNETLNRMYALVVHCKKIDLGLAVMPFEYQNLPYNEQRMYIQGHIEANKQLQNDDPSKIVFPVEGATNFSSFKERSILLAYRAYWQTPAGKEEIGKNTCKNSVDFNGYINGQTKSNWIRQKARSMKTRYCTIEGSKLARKGYEIFYKYLNHAKLGQKEESILAQSEEELLNLYTK